MAFPGLSKMLLTIFLMTQHGFICYLDGYGILIGTMVNVSINSGNYLVEIGTCAFQMMNNSWEIISW